MPHKNFFCIPLHIAMGDLVVSEKNSLPERGAKWPMMFRAPSSINRTVDSASVFNTKARLLMCDT